MAALSIWPSAQVTQRIECRNECTLYNLCAASSSMPQIDDSDQNPCGLSAVTTSRTSSVFSQMVDESMRQDDKTT